MRGVEVGEQKTYGHRLDTAVTQRPRRRAYSRFVERHQHVASRWYDPLGNREPMTTLRQRTVLPRHFLADRIMLRPLVPADVGDVAITGGGDHAGDRALVLEYGVGADRRAVQHVVDRLTRNAVARAQLDNTGDDTARRIVLCGRHLVDQIAPALGVGKDDIGKGAADIDPDQFHSRLTPLGQRRSRSARAAAAPAARQSAMCR